MRRFSPFGFAVLAVVLLGGVFYGGYLYGKTQVPSEYLVEGVTNLSLGQPDEVDFSLFWDAWRVLERKYADQASLNRQEMIYGAIAGMVNALGDPYTNFLKPEEAKLFREDISGSFEGVGIEIGLRNNVLTVIAPLKNSPADRAGIRAGDKILKIEETSTENMSLNEAVNLIRGQRGTTVRLTILRGDEDEVRDVAITRDRIEVPSLSWELRDGVAYVQLFSFSGNALKEFGRMAEDIQRSGADRMVLDLRNNPGGFLEVAQELTGWFVEPGEVVVTEDFGDEREDIVYRALGNGAFKNTKVVVLINEGSASASEIMAGALRDIRGVKLIGVQSFGKGSVQELEALSGGASLKITVARWLTPSGKSISKEGLKPDIEVELSSEDVDNGRDPQLDRALEVVKGL